MEWPTRSVRNIILERMESSEPQTSIVNFLKLHEGKRIDKRLVEKLNVACGRTDIRIRQIASMSNFEWGGYAMSGGNQGGSLLFAYQLKNLTVNTPFIMEHNIAYFGAAEARNKKRQEALDNPAVIADLEQTLQAYLDAREKLKKLFEYGSVFDPDEFSIKKAYDIKEEKA